MKPYLVNFSIVGTSDLPLEEFLENCDPMLIDEVYMTIKNILGLECRFRVEHVEVIGIDEE